MSKHDQTFRDLNRPKTPSATALIAGIAVDYNFNVDEIEPEILPAYIEQLLSEQTQVIGKTETTIVYHQF